MNTVQYKCPNCGAELTFDPEHQNFSGRKMGLRMRDREYRQVLLELRKTKTVKENR